MDFEILKFLPLIVAIFFAWKLRSVLGTKNGNEEAHKYDMPEFTPKEEKADNVVTLPNKKVSEQAKEEKIDDVSRRINEIAGKKKKLKEGLHKIRSMDAAFDPDSFLDGSKLAYEMIVTAFADGDVPTLQNLLDKEVFANFQNAINERTSRGEKVQAKFVGIESAHIAAAEATKQSARITVDFVCQMVSATLNKQGEVIEGDLNQVAENTDKWIFARSVKSDDPNWKLVATDA